MAKISNFHIDPAFDLARAVEALFPSRSPFRMAACKFNLWEKVHVLLLSQRGNSNDEPDLHAIVQKCDA